MSLLWHLEVENLSKGLIVGPSWSNVLERNLNCIFWLVCGIHLY